MDKYIEDDDCGYVPSLQFFICFMNALKDLHTKQGFEKIDKTKPILLIAGKEDPVGNYGETLIELNKLYNQYGIENTLKLYDGMRHEILNEVDNKIVYKDILDFINE